MRREHISSPCASCPMLVMMMVVGVEAIEAAVVVVEAEGAVIVVVVSEAKLNFDDERKSTVSHGSEIIM